jgi:uncharacterized protein involved in type VI secretion and phage assembly
MSHGLGPMNDLHLALVLDNEDPQGRGRIQIELQATRMTLWAPCVTNSAGNGYGISCLPRRDELVIVGFISPEFPVVLGAVWSGDSAHPQDAQAVEDKYTVVTPAGSKITLDDADGPQIKTETRSGYHITINEGSGEILIEKDSESIKLDSAGISIVASAKVEIQASQVNVSAGMVKVDAGMSNFSGVVKCDTLISNSVVSTSYTPGAGNVW